jgi:hypothetical protein
VITIVDRLQDDAVAGKTHNAQSIAPSVTFALPSHSSYAESLNRKKRSSVPGGSNDVHPPVQPGNRQR